MIVRSSNLALRFYESDGWTPGLLETCLARGFLRKSADYETELKELRYWALDIGGAFDTDKLMKHVTKLIRAFDDYPNETDREFIERYYW